ncbi:MAG: zinc ribbon domain-containing protein [Prevotellaceae bacterium]|nr:zinc ribbon domain-containing protein [Prevotellaceae bacterium]
MRRLLYILVIIQLCVCITSCYHERTPNKHDALTVPDSLEMTDSMPFHATHHYGIGYNFLVNSDSLLLIQQQPEEHISLLVTDTIYIPYDTHIAVADIRILPQDSIDSVWVQLVDEQGSTGWVHETEMLRNVVPTDPISQFIMLFSNTHVLLALIILVLISAAYIIRIIQRRQAHIVHFRDIPSFYPTLLCVTVAASATFYASLQMFGPDIWRHFYYHPSLNPFAMPPILCIFISSVWAMLIIGIAAVEDIRHHLNLEDTILYLSGLVGVCAIIYIIFSISTLYYIGYPLLILYCWYAISNYMRKFSQRYICGNCGKRIRKKGRCPHCNAINE